MSRVRRSIGQARFNLSNSRLVAVEFAAVGLLVGVLTDSWAWGVGTFFGLSVGCGLPVVGVLILLGFSGFWGVCFFSIGYQMGGIAGSVVIGSAGTFVALGLHLSGVQGLLDSAV